MGEMADYYLQADMDDNISVDELLPKRQQRKVPCGTWVQRDGTPIRIVDMADSHLRNTLRMLLRKAEAERVVTLDCFIGSIGPSDDMACELFDREFDAALEASVDNYLPEVYDDLLAEYERRGLDSEAL